MALEVPTSSESKVLQDRYNRQLAEEIERLKQLITDLQTENADLSTRLTALGG